MFERTATLSGASSARTGQEPLHERQRHEAQPSCRPPKCLPDRVATALEGVRYSLSAPKRSRGLRVQPLSLRTSFERAARSSSDRSFR